MAVSVFNLVLDFVFLELNLESDPPLNGCFLFQRVLQHGEEDFHLYC